YSATEQPANERDILRSEQTTRTAVTAQLTTLPSKVKCPQQSPLLEGAVNLSFESSLTLKDIEIESKGVTEGKYEPSDCTARQCRHHHPILQPRAAPPLPPSPPAPLSTEAAAALCHLCHPSGRSYKV
ncbi:hypothetical protein LDENG_00226390, partial [Lucifuga dentata]